MTEADAPTIVLCMAGLYRRFRDAGYETPKYLLPWGSSTVLAAVASELPSPRRLLVANAREQAYEADVLAAVPGAAVLWAGDTSGQAETAAIGAREAAARGWTGPVVFHNVDTIVAGRDLRRIAASLADRDGYIDVFRADSAAYSYVALDDRDPPEVTRIAEKVVISPWATTGMYGFASPAAYLAWAGRAKAAGKEFYVSDVYDAILQAGGRIAVDLGNSGNTIVLGTPAEYEAEVARCAR